MKTGANRKMKSRVILESNRIYYHMDRTLVQYYELVHLKVDHLDLHADRNMDS